jgi:hypothetical protein
MTADQLSQLRDIRKKLDEIRGNEDLVKQMKADTESLIREGVQEAKDKIDALASSDDGDELPF